MLGILVDPESIPYYIVMYNDNAYLYDEKDCYLLKGFKRSLGMAADLESFHGIDATGELLAWILNEAYFNLDNDLVKSHELSSEEEAAFRAIIESYEPTGAAPGTSLFGM